MEQDQDETVVVARTTAFVEEATIVTTVNPGVEEATVTNPTFSRSEQTSTGPGNFGHTEESEPAGPIPNFVTPILEVPVVDAEATFDREAGQVFEAPASVQTLAMPIPVIDTSVAYVVSPDEVQKSKPSADASKLFKKNLNRGKRNSLGVIITVLIGALLIGITLAVIWAGFN